MFILTEHRPVVYKLLMPNMIEIHAVVQALSRYTCRQTAFQKPLLAFTDAEDV
jgi:hypothetical protein